MRQPNYTYHLKIAAVLIFMIQYSSLSNAQDFKPQELLEFADSKKEEFSKQKKIKSLPFFQFYSFKDGKLPVIYQSSNLEMARALKNDFLWSGGVSGLSLSGNGQIIGYWDEDQPRLTHQEYSGRVSFLDSESGTNDDHATQMVGTMIATGVDADARGMANAAEVEAYNWNNDIGEMAQAAADSLTGSAHPYAEIAGWTTSSTVCGRGYTWYSLESENPSKAYQFGYYNSQAQDWDSVAYLAPNYLIVKAAGNIRGIGPESQPVKHWKIDSNLNCFEDSTSVRQINGGEGGFESISGSSVSKNVLVVGAVQSSVNDFSVLSSIIPTDGSGFGPTDDGRIKPDIVVPSGAYTSSASSNSAYSNSSGTSSSTAAVAGSVALIREHYQNLNADTLSSASIRALLAHSADDVGVGGPDYKMGWGLMNTERAVRFLSANHADNDRAVLKDTVLNSSNTIQINYEHTTTKPLIVTIAWTDPKGSVSVSGDDPEDIILVNDLDMQVSDPNSTVFSPWVMDKNNPGNAATTGDNDVDNIEQIYISEPVSGEYTITISHEGALQSGSQRFSVLISEAEPRVSFSTISVGNWSDTGTWLNGNIPSSIIDEAVIKHSIALTGDITIGSITFEGISSELKLSGHALSMYGSHQKSSGKGFSGDSLSKITVNGWEGGSDPIEFNSGNGKLSDLKVDVSADTVEIGSSLNIYQKLNLEAGSLKQTVGELTLISDENNTAQLIKNGGKLISDFVYSRAYREEASGWRMISSPVNDANFSSLNASFFTQGGSWASNMASAPNTSLWLFDSGNQNFNGYYGSDSTFTSGKGYLFYMFNTDPNGQQILPANLEMKGKEPDSLTLALYRGSHDSLSYNLVGNPFAGTLDWHEIVNDGTDLATSYAIWDPAVSSGGGSSGFKYYNMSGEIGSAGRYIAPMQGFFVQAINENSELRFNQSQKTESSPDKFGKKRPAQTVAYINLKLFGESDIPLDDQAHIVFSDRGSLGRDVFDVDRIRSLNQNKNSISFLSEKKDLRVFEGRPVDIENDKIDLRVELNSTGYYSISRGKMNNIPKDWAIKLTDKKVNKSVNLRERDEYEFYFDGDDESDSERFYIEVSRSMASLNEEKENIPSSFRLKQNYPNPFNPVTVIEYELPIQSDIKIEVFDILGRLATTLVDERKSAGFHSVQFNARNFSSGAYFYRIKAGDFVQIKSMMVIK